ncbi:hypothetical protein K438DRAFT_1984266 [Mycena galopus ATCC 62051]|nr:hypothetical protein K438DRAFT_1984266 [Mycena galopus ATCC 62051]
MSLYCDPPFHPDPGYNVHRDPGPFYLVVHPQARALGPGIYTSWPSCSAVVNGVSGASGKRYEARAECTQVWRARCDAGEHEHRGAAVPAPAYVEAPDLPSSLAHMRIADPAPAAPPTFGTPRRYPMPPATPSSTTSAYRARGSPSVAQSPESRAPATPRMTPLATTSHTPYCTPTSPHMPTSPGDGRVYYAVNSGSIVHNTYSAAHAQLLRLQRTDPSCTLATSTSHAYATLIALGIEDEDAKELAAKQEEETERRAEVLKDLVEKEIRSLGGREEDQFWE